jgi:hypothetical protein
MRGKAFAVAMGLCALALPASAQIIATSIPRAESAGQGKSATTGEKFALHFMVSPLSKWSYGELYIDYNLLLGSIKGSPNSKFLLAGEAAFALGSDFSVGVGGWYNKIGAHAFDFNGVVALPAYQGVSLGARIDTDIKIYEGHVGLFYKDVGIQGGVVKTTGRIGPNLTITSVAGTPTTGLEPIPITYPDAKTTDWDLFGVYKHSFGHTGSPRLGLALGAGMYRKEGIAEGSPLRAAESSTVFTTFGSLNLDLFKGLGLDVSYWYVAAPSSIAGTGDFANDRFSSDAQSRFTVGLAYTFSH